jgi:thiol-disulfide isomerase/thioredoxin
VCGAKARPAAHRRDRRAGYLLFLALLLPAPLPAAAPITWVKGFEAGLAQARARQRPAFVYFDAKWCSWCQRYKAETLADARVRARLARDYVAVLVDFDARADLVARYRIRGLPYTLILAPGGEVLNGFVGILTPDDLLDTLQRFAARAAPAEIAPGGEVQTRVAALDEAGYRAFRAAFLAHVENIYDAERGTLTRRFETGATLKRPSPLTWMYLAGDDLWRDRARRAAHAERARLLDPVDGGFFNFLDPSRPDGDYLESSKLLESNAWLTAWFAAAGADDPALRAAAGSGWLFLRERLWDRRDGGFWQAQVADQAYYALAPGPRRQAAPPPIDNMKRADTNAQAAWALVRFARAGGARAALDYAAGALDFVLTRMWREGRLYHFQRGETFSTPDVPQDWFWVLAAGAALDAERPDARRRERLRALSRTAAAWLQVRIEKAAPEMPDAELAGLIAWVAQERALYPRIPAAARDWALRQLHIRADTPPDDIVLGLMAWERALGR